MRIRARIAIGGNGLSLAAGDEADVDDATAVTLVRAGYALPLGPMPAETTAAVRPAETRPARKSKR